MTQLTEIVEDPVLVNPRGFGEKYGHVVVLCRANYTAYGKSKQRRWTYWCACDCGNIVELRDDRLRKKISNNLSCGCASFDHLKTHQLSKHELYGTYMQMLARCTKESSPAWKDYGGRGITVCSRWSSSDGLVNFISDMGPRPEGYSIERLDNSKGYSPDNCIWADRTTQVRNRRKRRNSATKYRGVSLTNGKPIANICLGSFESEEAAAKAYDDIYEYLFGTRPNNTMNGQ